MHHSKQSDLSFWVLVTSASRANTEFTFWLEADFLT